MAKQQDPNSLGAMMAAQNELASLNAGRLQNSQAEQAFLQQQQAANAVMMQAAQIGASGGVGQQVGAMNPQTQAILAQYGITGAPAMPGKTTSTSKTTQSGGNVKIENNTTTNNDIKIVNPGGGGGNAEAGNQAKFQAWLSNAFAKQGQEYEVQRRAFARRDRDLEKQSNKMMRELEKSTKGLSEKLDPENWQKAQGNQMKTFMTVLLLSLAPLLVKPITEGLDKIKAIFVGDSNNEPEFIKKLTKKLGGEDNQSFVNYLGEIIGSGIKRITDKLDLMAEDRKEAINSIEKPEKWGIESGLRYISNLLTAGLSGSKGLVKIEQREVKEKTVDAIGGYNRKGESIRRTDGYSFLTGGDFRNMMYDTDFNASGGLKNNIESHFAAVGTITSMANNTAGIGYSAAIKNLMSKVKKGVNEKTGFVLGGEIAARNFLKIFGASFEDFTKKGLLIQRKLYYFDRKNTTIRKFINGLRLNPISSTNPVSVNDGWLAGISKLVSEHKIVLDSTCKNPELMTADEYRQYVQKYSQDNNSVFSTILYELTEKGIKALENTIGTSFDDDSSESHDLLHSQLETYSGKTLTRDVDLSELQGAELTHSGYINGMRDIEGRQDAYGKAISGVTDFITTKMTRGIWKLDTNVIGGDTNGRYDNSEKGKIDFVNDLMTLYTKELVTYYKNKGLSDDEALKRASMVSQWLVGQDAMETAWGNSIIGNYNYGNIKKGSSWTGEVKVDSTYGEEWRSYKRPEEYIQDKLKVLSLKFYDNALMSNSLEEFTGKLQNGDKKYSASDTHLEYHNKVASMTDSIQRRLTKKNWVDEDKIEVSSQDSVSSSWGNTQIQTGNAVVKINRGSLMNPNNNLDEAIGGINVINEKGKSVSLRSFYKNLNESHIDFIEEDIKNEARRSLMYDIAGSKYEGYDTSSDSGPKISLGTFYDVDLFSNNAKEQLRKNDGKATHISYTVTLTKDLMGWRKIEINDYFNVTVIDDNGKILHITTATPQSTTLLYDKNDSFPEEWYRYTGWDKNKLYHKNPLLQQLFVDLTPNALEALKELLKTSQRNIKINGGIVEIEKEGNWEKATGNELMQLGQMGIIQSGSNDSNNPHSGYMFSPEYRGITETNAVLSNALSKYRENPRAFSSFFSEDPSTWNFGNKVDAAVDWANSKGSWIKTGVMKNPFVNGIVGGFTGTENKDGSLNANDPANSDSGSANVIVSNGGNTTINNNDNRAYYILGSNAQDITGG